MLGKSPKIIERVKMSLLPVTLPEYNKPVRAIVKFSSWKTEVVDLIAVDEDDVTWRTADDNSELSYAVDVVYWEYI